MTGIMPRMLPSDELEAMLLRYGIMPTDEYSKKGRVRTWRKRDGEALHISVHEEYPEYAVNKILAEAGLLNIPIYNSNQVRDDDLT